nr:CBO0543 family protein [Bacillus sp. DNRA2]
MRSPSSLKKLSRYGPNNFVERLSTILFGSLVATYLDLYFVGHGLYSFPMRPFPEIFSINILFTLIVLPFSLYVYFSVISMIKGWKRTGLILSLGMLAAVFEKFAEEQGWFSHQLNWHHYYTVFGFFIYLQLITLVYFWFKQLLRK